MVNRVWVWAGGYVYILAVACATFFSVFDNVGKYRQVDQLS